MPDRRNWMLAEGGQHPLCLVPLGSHVKVTGLTGKVASSEKASRGGADASTPRKCQIVTRLMKLREMYRERLGKSVPRHLNPVKMTFADVQA